MMISLMSSYLMMRTDPPLFNLAVISLYGAEKVSPRHPLFMSQIMVENDLFLDLNEKAAISIFKFVPTLIE